MAPPLPSVVVVVDGNVVVGVEGIVVVVVGGKVVVVVVWGTEVVVVVLTGVVVVDDKVVVAAIEVVVVAESLSEDGVEELTLAGLLSGTLSSSSPPSVEVAECRVGAGLATDVSCLPSTSTSLIRDPTLSIRVESELPAVEAKIETTTAARTPMIDRTIKMPLAASFIGSPAVGTLLTHSP